MWIETPGNSGHAKNLWGKQVVRREISPARERPVRDGCPGGARCQAKEIMTFFFTSVMIQCHEWGHQSDLKQPSQVQDIFNLPVMACFGGIAFHCLQKWAVLTHFTTTSPEREWKGAPFWWKSRFSTQNPATAGGGQRIMIKDTKGPFLAKIPKTDTQHPFSELNE